MDTWRREAGPGGVVWLEAKLSRDDDDFEEWEEEWGLVETSLSMVKLSGEDE